MKNYKTGIQLGIESILFSVVFVGIPFGTSILEIINTLLFIVGLLLIIYLGIIKKEDKYISKITIVFFLLLIILSTFIELYFHNFVLIGIGFLPGLIISIVGLLRTKANKGNYKTTNSFVLNLIGLIFSIVNFGLVVANGSFILNQ